MNENLSIQVPHQLFVGFTKISNQSVMLGIVTAFGEDSASIKRMDTVKNYIRVKNNTAVLPNDPMIGFRISRASRNGGWNSSESAIRIEDPRGFEVDIRSVNMIMLTDSTTIQNGEILNECVWGRDGRDIVLLPVNSQPYQLAIANSKRIAGKISLAEISIGDTILISSGETGIYMGPMYSVLRHIDRNERSQSILNKMQRRQVIRIQEPNGKVLYKGFQSFRVSEILKKASQQDISTSQYSHMIQEMSDGTAGATDKTMSNYNCICVGYVPDKFSNSGIQMIEFPNQDLDSIIADNPKKTIFAESQQSIYSFNTDENSFLLRSGNHSRYLNSKGYVKIPGIMSLEVNPCFFPTSEINSLLDSTMVFLNENENIKYMYAELKVTIEKTHQEFLLKM